MTNLPSRQWNFLIWEKFGSLCSDSAWKIHVSKVLKLKNRNFHISASRNIKNYPNRANSAKVTAVWKKDVPFFHECGGGMNTLFKVLQQRSSVFILCSNLGYVVSSPHQKSEFGVRGSQPLLESSETVSMSSGKCVRPPVCSGVSNPKISYLERGGGKVPFAPPLLKISAGEL